MKVNSMPIHPTNPEAVKDMNLPRQSTKGSRKVSDHQALSLIPRSPGRIIRKGFGGKLRDGLRGIGSKLQDKLRPPKPIRHLPSPALPIKIPAGVFGRPLPGMHLLPTKPGGDLSRFVGMSIEAAKKIAEKYHAREVEIMTPGSVTTKEYRADRLKLHVNDSGVVTRANWG